MGFRQHEGLPAHQHFAELADFVRLRFVTVPWHRRPPGDQRCFIIAVRHVVSSQTHTHTHTHTHTYSAVTLRSSFLRRLLIIQGGAVNTKTRPLLEFHHRKDPRGIAARQFLESIEMRER